MTLLAESAGNFHAARASRALDTPAYHKFGFESVFLFLEINFNLAINIKQIKREFCIRYLGILIDSNLNWKDQVECIVKKIRRSIGILSKHRYFVGLDILLSLYLICPYISFLDLWNNYLGKYL